VAAIGGLTVGFSQRSSPRTFMLWPIQDLARVYAEMQHSVASAERVFSLIDAVPDVVDRTARSIPLDSRRHRVRSCRFRLRRWQPC
jgi:ATP-binding cassette subfamily B protein